MLTRREVTVGGALTILFRGTQECLCANDSQAPHSMGCHLADADLKSIYPVGTDTRSYITGNEPIIPKSGDTNFDFALAQTLAKITETFGVLPGFAYYDDSINENAYATRRVRLDNIDGTVLMGINLLRRLKRGNESPEVAIAGVCSHEFGHILQYKHRLIENVDWGQPTVKRSELQADYFAGYYAGHRKRERPSYPAAVVATTQYSVGDTAFNDVSHHGTPEERGAAVVKGFEAAFRSNKSLNDAIQESTTYVLSL